MLPSGVCRAQPQGSERPAQPSAGSLEEQPDVTVWDAAGEGEEDVEWRSYGHGPLSTHPSSLQKLQGEERCSLCGCYQGGQVWILYNNRQLISKSLKVISLGCLSEMSAKFKQVDCNIWSPSWTLLCACDSLMKDYFYKPPINKLSLTFLEKSLESAYRISYQEEVCMCVCMCVWAVCMHDVTLLVCLRVSWVYMHKCIYFWLYKRVL